MAKYPGIGIVRFERSIQFRDSENEIIAQSKVCIYSVTHIPTQARYVGMTNNCNAAFITWYQRLASIDGYKSDLNVAFRAVYTKREDFVFKLLMAYSGEDIAAVPKKLEQAIALIEATLGKEFCLNVDKSIETRKFWMDRVPLSQREHRFGKWDGMSRSSRKRYKKIEKEREATRQVNYEINEGRSWLADLIKPRPAENDAPAVEDQVEQGNVAVQPEPIQRLDPNRPLTPERIAELEAMLQEYNRTHGDQ